MFAEVGERLRAWFGRNAAGTRTAIRTVEFGLSFACFLGVWFSGGDMTRVVPVLLLGWLFAIAGFFMTVGISIQWKTAWALVTCVVFVFEGWFVHHHLQNNIEDLRVSFSFQPQSTDGVEVKYILLNLGKQSALISGIDLFEVVSTTVARDAAGNMNLCDSVTATELEIASINILGPGSQVGGDKRRVSIYAPIKMKIDGDNWDAGNPMSIESGKVRIASADFVLEPSHTKGFSVIALCPTISTIDITGARGSSVCRGFAEAVRAGGSNSSWTTQRFRIVPHSHGVECPKTD